MSDTANDRTKNALAESEQAKWTTSLDVDLSHVGNLSPGYQHHDRLLTTGVPLILPGAFLKWYELRRSEISVPHEVAAEARSILTQAASMGELHFDYGLGFVVLHLSPPLAYLIVGSWRDNQEFWETLFFRDFRNQETFKRVAPGQNAPTLCVWELAPVWHERQAWTRFLYSSRDIAAKRSWTTDCLNGMV